MAASNENDSSRHRRHHSKTKADHHADLMMRLRNELNTQTFELIKYCLLTCEKLTEREAEKMNDFSVLWFTLTQNGIIGIGYYTVLKDILAGIPAPKLVKLIEEAEETIENCQTNAHPSQKVVEDTTVHYTSLPVGKLTTAIPVSEYDSGAIQESQALEEPPKSKQSVRPSSSQPWSEKIGPPSPSLYALPEQPVDGSIGPGPPSFKFPSTTEGLFEPDPSSSNALSGKLQTVPAKRNSKTPDRNEEKPYYQRSQSEVAITQEQANGHIDHFPRSRSESTDLEKMVLKFSQFGIDCGRGMNINCNQVPQTFCESCSKESVLRVAVCFCSDCKEYFCEAGYHKHIQRGHKIDLIATNSGVQAVSTISKEVCSAPGHRDHVVYCNECCKMFCQKCSTSRHLNSNCCPLKEYIEKTCKGILSAHKSAKIMLSNIRAEEQKYEIKRKECCSKGEHLKYQIEQATASVMKEILEKKERLLQDVDDIIESEGGYTSVQEMIDELEVTQKAGIQLLSIPISSKDHVNALQITLDKMKEMEERGNVQSNDQIEGPGCSLHTFKDNTAKLKSLELGYLEPFSRATKQVNYRCDLHTCFLESVALLPDGRAAVLGSTSPDGAAPKAIFMISEGGENKRMIKEDVGLGVDLIAYKNELVLLRKVKPYISFYSPEGGSRTLKLEGDLDDPVSIAVHESGQLVVIHGKEWERLALICGTKIYPDAGSSKGPGRLTSGKDIYCAFDDYIMHYMVNDTQQVLLMSCGQHLIDDFTIHGIKSTSNGSVYVVGEWWESIRIYKVMRKEESSGWNLQKVHTNVDSKGQPVKLAGNRGLCFDIRDNVLLLGYTNEDDLGRLKLFKLKPV